MKIKEVPAIDLKPGDIVYDADPIEGCSTKFKVVEIKDGDLLLKPLTDNHNYSLMENGIAPFDAIDNWYKEIK